MNLKKYLSKLFGEKKAKKYVQSCIDAAQCKGYIETVSNKADSLHKDIKCLYEEDLSINYNQLFLLLAPYFRKGKIRLGIDFHEKGFYGKSTSMYIIGTNYGGKSYKYAYEYISISLLTGKKDERLHLFALPCHLGEDRVKLIQTLIEFVKPFFGKIEVIQFDRGFYSKELVKWLEDTKLPFLMHIPTYKGKITNLVKTTKSFYRGEYIQKYNKDFTTHKMKTTLFICKNVKKHDWVFLSNIQFKRKFDLVNLYKNRWQIETNYSVSNQNRIMSKSTNYMIRYFYFLLDILLQILWRIFTSILTFKQYLKVLVEGLSKMLKKIPFFGLLPVKQKVKIKYN